MSPEFIDDGKGGQRLVFKDANDAIMRNAEKQLEPYTIGDLLMKELKQMGVLDEGRQATGTGTKTPKVTTTEQGIVIDLTGVRTQTEAQELIAQDVPWIWIVNIDHLYWVREGLKVAQQKIHPHGHGWSLVNNIDQWEWAE